MAILSWSGKPGPGRLGYGIFGQRFNSAGASLGPEFHVNTFTDEQNAPASAMDADGDFVVAWQHDWAPTLRHFRPALQFRRHAAGRRVPCAPTPFTTNMSPQRRGRPDGDFVVAWNGNGTGSADKRRHLHATAQEPVACTEPRHPGQHQHHGPARAVPGRWPPIRDGDSSCPGTRSDRSWTSSLSASTFCPPWSTSTATGSTCR